MKRRIFYVILAMLMVLMLSVVTGCGKKEQEGNPEVVEQEETGTDNDITENNTDETDNEIEADTGSEEDATETEPEELPVFSGIKDLYAYHGMIAGTCLSDMMISQSKYTDLIKQHFNTITLENNMKPDYILNRTESTEAGDIVVKFNQKTLDLLDWAKDNGMIVRGHTLVWHSQTPDWIFYEDFDKAKPLVDRETMLSRMESYIKQTFELLDTHGYSEMFYAYDVVNEAIEDNGTYRNSLWKRIIGEDYIWYAFYFADKYAPENIKLYYNDYNEQFKTKHLVNLAKTLVDENGRSLIDGIGCQGHLYTKDSIDQYMETLRAFSALGLEVQITELDVSLGTWQNILSATEENLIDQGKYYYELVNRIITENAAGTTAVSGITFWGFADNLSWRRDRSPLLFNSNLEPKYSFFGAMQDFANSGN